MEFFVFGVLSTERKIICNPSCDWWHSYRFVRVLAHTYIWSLCNLRCCSYHNTPPAAMQVKCMFVFLFSLSTKWKHTVISTGYEGEWDRFARSNEFDRKESGIDLQGVTNIASIRWQNSRALSSNCLISIVITSVCKLPMSWGWMIKINYNSLCDCHCILSNGKRLSSNTTKH